MREGRRAKKVHKTRRIKRVPTNQTCAPSTCFQESTPISVCTEAVEPAIHKRTFVSSTHQYIQPSSQSHNYQPPSSQPHNYQPILFPSQPPKKLSSVIYPSLNMPGSQPLCNTQRPVVLINRAETGQGSGDMPQFGPNSRTTQQYPLPSFPSKIYSDNHQAFLTQPQYIPYHQKSSFQAPLPFVSQSVNLGGCAGFQGMETKPQQIYYVPTTSNYVFLLPQNIINCTGQYNNSGSHNISSSFQ